MTEISQEEEEAIDNLKDKILELKRGDSVFNITINSIYCYGEVDFHSKEDLDVIEDFDFLNHLKEVGIKVPAGYDYDTHTANWPKYTETWSPAFLTKFAHASLDKPKRIVLFKCEYKK